VLGLWRTTTFLRASNDDASQIRPTVTFRCTEIMLSAHERDPTLFDADGLAILNEAADVVAALSHQDALAASELNYAPFTLALYTLAVSRVAGAPMKASIVARGRVTPAVRELLKRIAPKDLEGVHPFVQEHVLRALKAAEPLVSAPLQKKLGALSAAIVAAARPQAEALLAKHHMALISPGESVALAFCAAVLATSTAPREQRVAVASLRAVITAQDSGGSWPLGRVVQSEPSRLEVSTYEVAWIVASTASVLFAGLGTDHDDTVREVTRSVDCASEFAQRSLIDLDDQQGWASDHPYQAPRIESWTSAIALQFMLASEDLRARYAESQHLADLHQRRSARRPLALVAPLEQAQDGGRPRSRITRLRVPGRSRRCPDQETSAPASLRRRRDGVRTSVRAARHLKDDHRPGRGRRTPVAGGVLESRHIH
jgi:hypothetical protein